MKKTAVLLVLVLALLVSAACADNPYASMTDEELNLAYQQITEEMNARTMAKTQTQPQEGDITFRGIPWGTSATEFAAVMKEAGVSGSASKQMIYSWERINLAEGVVTCTTIADDRGFVYRVTPKNFSVAGVPVSEISAYFTYGYDAETVYTTPEQSSLYHAVYSFDGVADPLATADVLYQKMCSVYGETPRMMATKPKSNFTGYYDYAIWEDGNGNAVLLINTYYLNTDGTPYTGYVWNLDLCYGKTNSVELIDAVTQAMAREESEAMAADSSVDGL